MNDESSPSDSGGSRSGNENRPVPTPFQCVFCKKNRAEEKEQIRCIVKKINQQDNLVFECDEFEPVFDIEE